MQFWFFLILNVLQKTIYSFFVKKYQIKKKNIKIKHYSNLIKILKSEKSDLQKIVENKYPKVKIY